MATSDRTIFERLQKHNPNVPWGTNIWYPITLGVGVMKTFAICRWYGGDHVGQYFIVYWPDPAMRATAPIPEAPRMHFPQIGVPYATRQQALDAVAQIDAILYPMGPLDDLYPHIP